jgi:hypothetical protein
MTNDTFADLNVHFLTPVKSGVSADNCQTMSDVRSIKQKEGDLFR